MPQVSAPQRATASKIEISYPPPYQCLFGIFNIAPGICGDASRKRRRVSSYNRHQENALVTHGLFLPASDLGLTGKTNFSTLGRRSPPVSQGGLIMIFSRKAIAKSTLRVVLAGIFFALGLGHLPEVFAQGPAAEASAPLILRSTLENLSRGFIPARAPPAVRIKSGQTVQVDTFSHHGFVDDPVTFFKGYGISPEMILPDLIAASKKLPRPKDGGT